MLTFSGGCRPNFLRTSKQLDDGFIADIKVLQTATHAHPVSREIDSRFQAKLLGQIRLKRVTTITCNDHHLQIGRLILNSMLGSKVVDEHDFVRQAVWIVDTVDWLTNITGKEINTAVYIR